MSENPSYAWLTPFLEARRADLKGEVCPTGARHRAHGLFDRRPTGVWETVARMAFDSWALTGALTGALPGAPPLRGPGAQRLLRYESAGALLDVELSFDEDTSTVRVQAAVEGDGVGPGSYVDLVREGADTPVRMLLDEGGAGSLVTEAYGDLVLIVGDEDGELLRSPPVPLA